MSLNLQWIQIQVCDWFDSWTKLVICLKKISFENNLSSFRWQRNVRRQKKTFGLVQRTEKKTLECVHNKFFFLPFLSNYIEWRTHKIFFEKFHQNKTPFEAQKWNRFEFDAMNLWNFIILLLSSVMTIFFFFILFFSSLLFFFALWSIPNRFESISLQKLTIQDS